MASVAPPADQAVDLLQKLSIDSEQKPSEASDSTKKPNLNQSGEVDTGEEQNGLAMPYERSMTPILQEFMDPAMCYVPSGYPQAAYYYGAYDGTGGEWDEFSHYANPDGVEIPQGVYGENGALIYHTGYGYGAYPPYSPASSPVPSMGQDGQIYGPQHYQYPTYFQPLNPNSGPYNPITNTLKSEVSTSSASDQSSVAVEAANGIPSSVPNGSVPKALTDTASSMNPPPQSQPFSSNGHVRPVVSGYQDPRYIYDGHRSPIPWMDGSMLSEYLPHPGSTVPASSMLPNNVASTRNQNVRPHSNSMQNVHHPRPPVSGIGVCPGYMNRGYGSKMYGLYGSMLKPGFGYGSALYDTRSNTRGWLPVDNKFKQRARGGFYGYGNENIDGLNELSRGPRAKTSRVSKGTPLTVKAQNEEVDSGNDEKKEVVVTSPYEEQYNKTEFVDKYTDAKFFIIKSYSEDDVHKSIKYNMWASTANGNKKLDAAYQEAQGKMDPCPIFLLFSVNTSGQFVGLAEMVGSVDFQKNLEYWQQDKWIGCFPVKWHIVKDIPNSLLKHIILENNENKPVTNSRDTQEVKLEQGLQIIKIFKEHCSKTCILDDFEFYEGRQKTIQEKKAKQQFQKQIWEGKVVSENRADLAEGQGVPLDLCEKVAECSVEKQPGGGVSVNKSTTPASQLIPNGVPNGVVNGY